MIQEPRPAAGTETGIGRDAADPAPAYDGSRLVFRVLRSVGWGPLMNLGRFRPWDELLHPFRLDVAQQRLVRSTVGLLGVGAGQRVLDVGCGRGASAYQIALAHPGAQVVGIDLLPENVQVGSILYAHTANLQLRVGRAEALPFDDHSIDRIHCLEAAFHFDRDAFLQEAARLLRPGGRLVVVDFVLRRPSSARALAGAEGELVREVWRFRDFWTRDQYLDSARRHGLRTALERDWTRSVSAALQRRFLLAAWLCARTPVLRLAQRLHPPWRSFSRVHWLELLRLARAHGTLCRASRYLALVLEPADREARRPGESSAADVGRSAGVPEGRGGLARASQESDPRRSRAGGSKTDTIVTRGLTQTSAVPVGGEG